MPATARAAAKTPPTGITMLPATPEEEVPDAVLDFVELPDEDPVEEEVVVVAVPLEVLVVEPVIEEPVSLAN